MPNVDPRDAAIVDAVVERIAELFGPRHDALARRLDEVERQLEALERIGAELQRGPTLTEVLASSLNAGAEPGITEPEPPRLTPTTPRPTAIDRACAKDPAQGPPRAAIPELGNMVVYPKRGATPADVWEAVTQSVDAEGGVREIRRSRRARNR